MITQERLKELFDYKNGFLINKVSRCSTSPVGRISQRTRTNGYSGTFVDGTEYATHRLIWLYFTGLHPNGDIDHINGVRSDNRFENLREATRAQNMQNEKRARRTNKCGLLGVSLHGTRWRAQIVIDGKRIGLGSYATPEQAHEVYLAKKKELHPFQTIA
jgi:hypothetical protein